VAAYAELPKELTYLALIPPDPSLPQTITAEKQIAEFFGGKDDACHLI
jgi:hypothetical protein